MEKMSIDKKLIDLVKMVYKDPQFIVETDGIQSDWHHQTAGIRQGCPMSPYFFLIAMTTIFSDIKHDNQNLTNTVKENRTKGTEFDEILYADDTILASEDKAAVQKYVRAIEKKSGKYGLKLNRSKCEQISIN